MNSKFKPSLLLIGAILAIAVMGSSVQADSVHALKMDSDFEGNDLSQFTLKNFEQIPPGYAQGEHWDEGKHLGFVIGKHNGFTTSSVAQGPRLTVVGYYSPSAIAPTPEPTSMLLLGTGLAGLGAYARRGYQRRG